MENFLEFETSITFKISSFSLAILNILFFFSNIFLINTISINKDKIKIKKLDFSFLSIIFQLIFCSLFFIILVKLYIKNTTFLIISNLIGIVLSLEWYYIYIYYLIHEKIINVFFYILIPMIFLLCQFLLFFLLSDFNKLFESIIKNISFIFYVCMFITPGSYIIKMLKTGNPIYIMIHKSIIGILLNIAMIIFIISLNYFGIIEFYFITYPIISLLICAFEVIFYFSKINSINNEDDDNFIDINPGLSDFENDDDSKKKKISLVSKSSFEG